MTIFREYIDGSKKDPDNLHDFSHHIINSNIKEFHFIIAFATEVYDGTERGTGKFYWNWAIRDFDGERIYNLTKRFEHGNVKVKVVISIGGRGIRYPFNPASGMWFDNARNSLIEIINYFKDPCGNIVIDGIDINYDTIIVNPSDREDVFANYIGRVKDNLRNENQLVNVVSIAPSFSVQAHYQALYAAHGKNIDWVNCRFYSQKIARAYQFNGLYRQLANAAYARHKLLAGFSTDPRDRGNLPREVFFEACGDLINNGDLPGIFFWNANESALDELHFNVEKKAQKLLTQN